MWQPVQCVVVMVGAVGIDAHWVRKQLKIVCYSTENCSKLCVIQLTLHYLFLIFLVWFWNIDETLYTIWSIHVLHSANHARPKSIHEVHKGRDERRETMRHNKYLERCEQIPERRAMRFTLLYVKWNVSMFFCCLQLCTANDIPIHALMCLLSGHHCLLVLTLCVPTL